MKPEKPITRKEMYLDVATGGSTELPSPVTREEKYLAKIAGESVDVPTPVTRYEMLLAAVAGESYTLTPATRLEIYLAKAAGQDVEVPQPITREEMYWFDYVSGQPTPSEREYTGAVPVTFTANGQSLLDYLISGNTVQNGTPTPDNPIIPQGTGERTGNLLSEKYENRSINGVGAFTIDKNYDLWLGEVVEGQTYTISNMDYVYGFFTSKPLSNTGVTYDGTREYEISGTAVVTVPPGCTWIAVRVLQNADNAMLNTGETALPYEPFGVKIPISSANTTTPVYLGEVQTTRKVKKYECTGDENWRFYSDSAGEYGAWQFYIDNAVNGLALSSALSNIAEYGATAPTRSRYPYGVYLVTNGTGIAFQMAGAKDIFPNVTAWKFYLAQQYANGTPVAVWYALATEETAVVNEPLMRIGDYADTLSMEQAGVQIPTANGSTTLDVETTVPPSEAYIKYRGEAVATLSSLPAEVSSTEETPEEADPEETEETENGSEDVSLQYKPEAIE